MQDKNYQLPIHYSLVMVASLFFYKNSKNIQFIAISNALFTLLTASILISPLGMSHRIVALMLPFIVISLSYQVLEISNISARYSAQVFILLNFAVLSAFVYGLINNFDLLLTHLS